MPNSKVQYYYTTIVQAISLDGVVLEKSTMIHVPMSSSSIKEIENVYYVIFIDFSKQLHSNVSKENMDLIRVIVRF